MVDKTEVVHGIEDSSDDSESDTKIGYDEDEVCNRGGCNGVIEIFQEPCCCATSHPPCSNCENSILLCPECEWDSETGYWP